MKFLKSIKLGLQQGQAINGKLTLCLRVCRVARFLYALFHYPHEQRAKQTCLYVYLATSARVKYPTALMPGLRPVPLLALQVMSGRDPQAHWFSFISCYTV